MCGIAGIVLEDGQQPVEADLLVRMMDRLRHRGPDDRASWTDLGVGLAHTRLSIIDLSAAGRQPMSNEDGSVRVVYNGEIYNFLELRSELVGRGHRFRSMTDTEVIVHLYEDEGDALLHRLQGMFALAVWDARRRRLLLARDRVGKKPLKYARTDDGLIFASELKAILATGLVPADVDLEAVHQYLGLGYVPGPRTGFSRIHKLPPAHKLVWENGRISLERYWELDFTRKAERSEDDWKEECRQTVERAVRRRLIGDVPLGAFLSGGIDSTIVVACMAQALDRPVETFSIGFEYEKFNELPHARKVADRYRTAHHEFIVRPEAAELLPRLAAQYEEPYADSSALPTFCLARETRRFVKVALNGDGGDEGFSGYTRYARLERWASRLAVLGKTGLHSLTRIPLSASPRVPTRLIRWIDRISNVVHPDPAARYAWMMRLFSERDLAALYRDDLRRFLGQGVAERWRDLMRQPGSGESTIDRMLYADTMLYLPDDLLVKVDIATMAHGLEARSPFLDHEVLELAASAPARLKLRSGRLKWLLKEAFREVIPPDLIDRKKQGFGIPMNEWFRGPLAPLLHDLVLSDDSRVSEYLRRDVLRGLAAQHATKQFSHGHRLWALVMLELWHRHVVEEAATSTRGTAGVSSGASRWP